MNKKIFPDRITIELTNRCNLACTFCHRTEFVMELGNMDDNMYKKIIDEMAEHLPVSMVPFFRGESLLHPHFIEFMNYAKSKGIGPIQLTSNGYLLDEGMAEKILEAKIDFISFSLDTLDEKKYVESRKNGNLRRSMDNIKRFVEICEHYKKEGKFTPIIQVSTVDVEAYREGQKEFIEYWKEYVDFVRIYEEHDNNGRFRNPAVSEKLNLISERYPCKKLYRDMVINWDGSIALCCYDWNETHDLGNINDYSIEEIWNSNSMKDIRRMHETDSITSDYICRECEHWKADYIEQKFLGKKYEGKSKINE